MKRFGAIAFSSLLLAVLSVQGAAESPSTPAQRAEIKRLLDEFSAPKATVEQRGQIVEKLLGQGDDGPRRLLPLIVREFKAKQPAYLARFEKSAQETVRSRFNSQTDSQVAALRRQVLAVSRGGNVTKDAIVERCDPAMKKLDELLSATPEQVFEHDSQLKAKRDELVAMRSWWEQAVSKLPEEKHDPPPKAPSEEELDKALKESEELAALMATPMSAADRAVLLKNRATAQKIDPLEGDGIQILNMMRIRLGIGAQAIDPRLCEAARGHSKDMHDQNFFDHTSPVPGKKTPWNRAQLAGTTADAENIFMGSPSPKAAIEGWWHSPGHHVNMMAAHKRVGLGRFEAHWTQMFGD